jgi:hypothetical protein
MQEVMVQSASAPLRAMCASALLQFLLDWPLDERRLRQHLEKLVSNLGYEHEEGRLQVCSDVFTCNILCAKCLGV